MNDLENGPGFHLIRGRSYHLPAQYRRLVVLLHVAQDAFAAGMPAAGPDPALDLQGNHLLDPGIVESPAARRGESEFADYRRQSGEFVKLERFVRFHFVPQYRCFPFVPFGVTSSRRISMWQIVLTRSRLSLQPIAISP